MLPLRGRSCEIHVKSEETAASVSTFQITHPVIVLADQEQTALLTTKDDAEEITDIWVTPLTEAEFQFPIPYR